MKDGTVLYEDPATGYKQKFYYDVDERGNETVTIKHCWNPQNVQQVLEFNKKVQGMGDGAYKSITPGETDMWYAAQIPHHVQYKWLLEEGIDICKPEHWSAVKRKLNDPEWRYLRTGDFKL